MILKYFLATHILQWTALVVGTSLCLQLSQNFGEGRRRPVVTEPGVCCLRLSPILAWEELVERPLGGFWEPFGL